MNIFVIPSVYPNDFNQSSGIFVHEQCKALNQFGHHIIVLDAISNDWRHWFDQSCRKIIYHKIDDIPVYSYHYKGLALNRLPSLSIRNYVKKLEKIFIEAIKREGKPDILYAHFTFTSGYAASILSKKYGIPFVVQEHYSLFLQDSLHPKIIKMLNETLEAAAAFICVSEKLKNAVIKWTGTKKEIRVIPNMLNPIFTYAPLQPKDHYLFFSAGNLVPSKRFDLLINAFCNAFTADDPVKLEIAGDGEMKKNLLNQIRSHERIDQIKLIGRLDSDKMNECYQRCDAFVLPSQYETFGIVYREAMAVGRPVISTRNGGIEDGWQDGFGKLIEVDNEEQLICSLLEIYKTADEYDGETISKDVLSKYSSKVVMKKILEYPILST